MPNVLFKHPKPVSNQRWDCKKFIFGLVKKLAASIKAIYFTREFANFIVSANVWVAHSWSKTNGRTERQAKENI